MPSKERLVLCLPKSYRNQLLWLAMKHRTTMSNYVGAFLNERFFHEIPAGFDVSEAMYMVGQPDFEPDMIPYDAEGEFQYRG